MSGDLGPGDWVECIRSWPEIPIERGAVYLVEEVRPRKNGCSACSDCPRVGLVLRGVCPEVSGYIKGSSICVSQFRPIYRPKADFIESLKAPPVTTDREVETA